MNAPLRYLSVCSGIEAASVAWTPLGWTPLGFAEIDRFPSRVLAHRFGSNMPGEPLAANGVPNHGDFTAIDIDALGPVDLLVGGTPCQAFSVAGRRLSLADARGNLALAFTVLMHGLARSHGLRWAVWENVPGVLSTDDNAFGCLLGALVGGDAAVPLPAGAERWPDHGMVAGPRARAAWRVLDAQWFGLAQRRRRVFVVVGAGDGCDPAAVLFEPQGLRRHPPSRGEAGAGVAGCLGAGPAGGRGADDNDARGGRLIAFGGNDTRGPIDISTALNAHGGPCGRQDFESETFVVASALRARDGAKGVDSGCTDALIVEPLPILESGKRTGTSATSGKAGDGFGSPGDPMFTLGADSRHAIAFDTTQITSRENRCDPQPGDPCHPLAASAHPPAIAFTCKDHGQDVGDDVAPTLRGMSGTHANAGGQAAVCFPITNDALRGEGAALTASPDAAGRVRFRDPGLGVGTACDPAGTLTAAGPGAVATPWSVRRLSPTECERLQGFPDGWTSIPDAADGPRYRALGNSMAVPVMRWIGKRIAGVGTAAPLLQAAE